MQNEMSIMRQALQFVSTLLHCCHGSRHEATMSHTFCFSVLLSYVVRCIATLRRSHLKTQNLSGDIHMIEHPAEDLCTSQGSMRPPVPHVDCQCLELALAGIALPSKV